MAVYVDDMYLHPMGQFGRMKMSHLIADTREELLAMVDRIGVQRKWIQKEGTRHEHFDIAMQNREKAIAAGAIPLPMRELCEMWHNRDVAMETAMRAGTTREDVLRGMIQGAYPLIPPNTVDA